VAVWFGATACFSPTAGNDASGTESIGSEDSTTAAPTSDPTIADSSGSETSSTAEDSTTTATLDVPSECGEDGCRPLDVLVVVDNSRTMAEEQRQLARDMLALVGRLEQIELGGDPLDVQVMVTTTDVGNPLCTPFEPKEYEPARGAPTSIGCNARIDDFVALGSAEPQPETCTSVCPVDVAPDDAFVAFAGATSNVPGAAPIDVDGDGTPDSAAAQALACLLPQGMNGCGFESPLEAMLLALDPAAEWNTGARPFLRPEADLAILVLTDEADCSLADASAMEDPSYQEVNPYTQSPAPSSAVCWNMGVVCDGPDAQGVYTSCTTTEDGPLHAPQRYIDRVVGELREAEGKDVMFVAVAGVPTVTAHSDAPPFEPLAGGLPDLVYRDWLDGEYPAGDVLPIEWSEGVTAADKQFDFGIGPACTGEDLRGGFVGQAIPNPRLFDVCRSLDGDAGARCCIESACDSDYAGALTCIEGLIADR
jgi:hypothetical protein